MKAITVSELSQRTTTVLKDLEASGEPLVLLRHGTPVAFVVAVDSTIGQDLILAFDPSMAQLLTAADRDRLAGRGQRWDPATRC